MTPPRQRGEEATAADAPVAPAVIATRYRRVRARIEDAARRSGRDPAAVTLVVVTKAFDPTAVRAALAAGALDLGENYVQEAVRKMEALESDVASDPERVLRWHFVGRLQQNKAAKAARLFDVIHTLDSEALGRRLDGIGARRARKIHVLVEVNTGGEPSKAGVQYRDAGDLVRTLTTLEHLRVDGLMTIPPFSLDPEASRPYFRALASLRNDLALRGFDLPHLSMGMTDDYEVAIEEGATIVRVGRGIFGERPRRAGAASPSSHGSRQRAAAAR